MTKLRNLLGWVVAIISLPIDIIITIPAVILVVIAFIAGGIIVRVGKKIDSDWLYAGRIREESAIKFGKILITLYQKIAGL